VKFSVVYKSSVPASASPYRLFDEQGEIAWANSFLDAQRIRQLSVRSLRAYAYDLLNFARWWAQHPAKPLSEVTESTLLDYVRYQLDQQPKPTPQTVNHRLVVIRCLYRFHLGTEILPGQSHFRRAYTKRSPLGYGRPRRAMALGLRLKQPRRIVVPLSAGQVAVFWRSFHSFRDLALVGLMLLDGLRSCEVLSLQLEVIDVLQNYLRLERPLTNSPSVFVCLKGRHRGQSMTPAGLRSLFRSHRSGCRIPQANPHRLRHTFGSDMVRAGISLPALQHLMGHSQIHTTMLYVFLAPQDVWREFARAVGKRAEPGSSEAL
jgi:integrase/recombinase XerD